MSEPQDGLMPLRLRGLSLRFGPRAVFEGLDLDLPAAGCTVILGANGAGKSLLLQMLHGIRAPDAGRIDWNGRRPDQAMRRQAMVFQKPVLLRRSVAANLDFVLRARGLPVARRAGWLALAGLSDKAHQPARRLSGGEAQRLALVRALASEPELLLLDEPTASLDPAANAALEALIGETRARGVQVILVTHDRAQARRLADRVVFLHHGRVLENAPAADFFPHPTSPEARAYLAGDLVL